MDTIWCKRLASSFILASTITSLDSNAVFAQSSNILLPSITVTASRIGLGITGASNSIITADDIARSPGSTRGRNGTGASRFR